MTADARRMVDAAIQAVDPVEAVRAFLQVDKAGILSVGDQTYNLASDYDTIVVAAFGKASAAMACSVVDCLLEGGAASFENKLVGLVIAKDGHVSRAEQEKLQRNNILVREAAHPVPDGRSVSASEELLDLVEQHASEKTLVLACISGGGSALFCSPASTLTLQDLQATNTALLQTGWRIQDMNVVRKRLERGKGGGLARAAGASTTISLILSDVLGDPLDLIASGPTVRDSSNFGTAWKLMEEQWPANIELPPAVLQVLREGYEQEKQNSRTTPTDHCSETWSRTYNCLVGNNAIAVDAAAKTAQRLGYHPVVLGTQVQGEASTVAQVLAGLAQHLRRGSPDFSLASSFPVALIAGGETTVTLSASSSGIGGRNQELALTAALELQSMGLRQVVIASVGTDGTDGPTDAAGAIVDGGTVDRLAGVVEESAEKALQMHNAYVYLNHKDAEGISPLVKIGPTGTNVADICIVLVQKREDDS